MDYDSIIEEMRKAAAMRSTSTRKRDAYNAGIRAITALMAEIEQVKHMRFSDVSSKVHGRWIYVPLNMDSSYFAYKNNLRKKCSVCKYAMPYEYPNFNICPNCGAKMDGRDEP